MGGDEKFVSLDRALHEVKMPVENHRFVKDMVHAAGATQFYVAGTFIIAKRPGTKRALNIARGSTNGFESEQDARDAVPDGTVVEPSAIARGWKVSHPLGSPGRDSSPLSGRTPPRDNGPCPACGSPRAASGACTSPDCELA